MFRKEILKISYTLGHYKKCYDKSKTKETSIFILCCHIEKYGLAVSFLELNTTGYLESQYEPIFILCSITGVIYSFRLQNLNFGLQQNVKA